MPNLEYPKSPDTPTSHLPFSPAVVYGDLIFVSGQASVDKTGKIMTGTFEEEFRRSLENLKQILSDAGSDLTHVVQTRNYVDREEDFPEYQKLYREYFREPFPARTTISNCLNRAIRYEIDVIAVKKKSSGST
jgi:2-iminobutanoate/2-iminopropanoate deaminase